MPNIELIHGDCMEIMARYPDKYFELACVDPPYGIDMGKKHTGPGWIQRESKDWDSCVPGKIFFKNLFRVSINQIIWGGNYFTDNLYPSMGWVFWDKGQRNFSLADGELAWTSFQRALRVVDFSRSKANQDPFKNHPTRKPIYLYRWLLHNYAKPGDKILDTHLGSGSSAIAAHQMGFDFVGCELDTDYYNAACKRFKEQTAQQTLFK